jgi:hypothetical protein
MEDKMAFEDEYFIMRSENNDNYPLLTLNKGSYNYEHKNNIIENPQTVVYRIAKPIPKKPVMVDYHTSPYSVISDRIYSVLNNFNLKNVQFIPAIITTEKKEYNNYWYLHSVNAFPVLDLDKSKCEWDDFIKVASPIEKIIFKELELKKIKEEERLLFCLSENKLFRIFHRKIVDEIMKIEPKGLQFIKVNEYGRGMYCE